MKTNLPLPLRSIHPVGELDTNQEANQHKLYEQVPKSVQALSTEPWSGLEKLEVGVKNTLEYWIPDMEFT